ncbi:hypothetical protein [Galbibacter mesophilus]|uniref:hypothetical protein n=1 Tax=Galbibacter mesophilus TaxID=379069 RepID=UPI00191CB631|nr:hypothetical protein [Galbibacter mesophilus]MCM5662140.1 hypothetical protein [Galbibacter mesophilus]
MLRNLFVQAVFLLILIIGLSGCDQTRQRNQGNQLFTKNPQLASYEYSHKTIPEGYAEVKTDSILANGFSASTTYFTHLQSRVYKIEKDRVNQFHKTEYYDFHSDILVYFENQLVLDTKITKELFRNENTDFWNASYMQDFHIDEKASSKNRLAFKVTFYNPSEEKFLDYHVLVDSNGQYEIEGVKA